jgi:TonB-dependent SusC/RagA subfamily outer membrane receptor
MIEVSEDVTSLVFTFVGMKVKEAPLGESNVVNVQLEPEVIGVNEVVVTALGISREKKSLGYAVQEVSGDDVNMVKGNDFVSSMSGKVAGVQIKANTNFGGSTNVIVRGSASLSGNNQALFVVDGVPIDNAILNDKYQQRGGTGYDYGNASSDINPNDIASITVLKGAAATALYGSRAANGVILITSKKGKKNNEPGVTITSNYTRGTVDKSTFAEYQNEFGGGYGRDWYSASDRPGLEYWDFNGDGVDEYIDPTYEDASMGEKFDPSLMVYQWNSFTPGLDTYGKPQPWKAAEHGPIDFFQTAHSFSNSVQIAGGGEDLLIGFHTKIYIKLVLCQTVS